MSTVLLLTDSFPFGSGEQFLESEMPFLARSGNRVIVAPARASGPRRHLPDGVFTDVSLATARRRRASLATHGLLAAALSPCWWYEVMRARRELGLGPRILKQIVARFSHAVAVRDWIWRTVPEGASARDVLVYSYWLGEATLGGILARSRLPDLRVVSRSHGVDLYDERHSPPFIAFRDAAVAGADRVFTVSAHGADYLSQRHPRHRDRVQVARLGVPDPGFRTAPSDDGIFRIVTCAFLVPVKRIDLLVRALGELGRLEPSRRIEWSHIGDGPLEREIRTLATTLLPPNVSYRLVGRLPNAEVTRFYRDHPVDLFVNVSASEGAPVSIMEAQSCGIPVMATSVGGTPELVNSSNGWLLPPHPQALDVAANLRTVLCSTRPTDRLKRDRSRATWEALSNADWNFPAFMRELLRTDEAA